VDFGAFISGLTSFDFVFFLILFGFIGVFTYVGFVLMRPPHALSMTATT